jgi:hypothetical protein
MCRATFLTKDTFRRAHSIHSLRQRLMQTPDSGAKVHARRRGRLYLLLAGWLLGLGFAELLARESFDWRPHMRNRIYFAEPDPLLGWRNRPNASGPYGSEEFTTTVTINAAGQRGPLYPTARKPGTRRMVILGDSQAWGDGVEDNETFAALLDHSMPEVLNFSCPGYGTDQELLVLDQIAARYAPDVVLVALFVGNDFLDNMSPGSWQYPKPFFALEPPDRLALHGVPVEYSRSLHSAIEVYRGLMRHSAIANVLADAFHRTWNAPLLIRPALAAEPWVPHSFYEREASADDQAAFALTIRLLIEIARHSRAIGARPVVLIIPELWQVDLERIPGPRRALAAAGAKWRRPQQVLDAVLPAEGIQVIDALPALARAQRAGFPAGKQVFYRGWRHLTSYGHAVVARLVRARLGGSPTGTETPGRADAVGTPGKS